MTGSDCRLGVVAFGDSITNGGGELQWGVALQSWAQWVARAVGLPFTNHAVDAATARDVVERQIRAFERRSAHPQGRYDLGCLYIGVNDVRDPGFSSDAFERDYRAALHFLGGRCDRTLVMTIPLDLGRPRAGPKAAEANAVIESLAAPLGALVVDLSSFSARNLVMADHVHPTAFGQIALAERALAVLDRDGLTARVQPRALISYRTTWLGRLRGDWTYAYRHAKVSCEALWRRRRASSA
jgi:lysophospholipase L1-like esterase